MLGFMPKSLGLGLSVPSFGSMAEGLGLGLVVPTFRVYGGEFEVELLGACLMDTCH